MKVTRQPARIIV